MSRLATRALLGLVHLYQAAVSPFLPVSCRFIPTCSEYAVEAVRRFGPVRGSLRALRRLLRCHPLGPFGHDPVE